MDAVEAERLPHRPHLVHEQLDRPQVGVVRPVGAAAAELVVDHDSPSALGELLQGLEVMVRGAGPAVEAEERDSAFGADVAVPRLETAERDAALDDSHGRSGSRTAGQPSAPGNGVGREPRKSGRSAALSRTGIRPGPRRWPRMPAAQGSSPNEVTPSARTPRSSQQQRHRVARMDHVVIGVA